MDGHKRDMKNTFALSVAPRASRSASPALASSSANWGKSCWPRLRIYRMNLHEELRAELAQSMYSTKD